MPHAGEMADKMAVQAAPLGVGHEAAAMFWAVVVMKGAATLGVSPGGSAWHHDGGVAGLGTSESGDVLTGVIGGFLAGSAAPTTALRGLVLHVEAGWALTKSGALLDFLTRALPRGLPFVLAQVCAGLGHQA